MSIQDTIVVDTNNSSREVEVRAVDEMRAEDIRSQRLQNDIIEQDKNERKDYATVLFTVTIMWLFLVLGIFISVGKGMLVYSDSVIITLLTTTTANVLGLVAIVANYLFKK
jgi:hypothetical protein